MVNSPKRCHAGDVCAPETLQESLYCLSRHSKVPLKQIADAIGRTPTYLANATNPDLDTVHFQAADLAPAMKAADNYTPLHFIAHQCGFFLLPMPKATDSTADVRQKFMRAAKEFGDVAQEIDLALADDNQVDDRELSRIDTAIAEHLDALTQVRHALTAKRSAK